MVKKQAKRVLVIGLDCAEPNLVFNLFSSRLQTLRTIGETGCACRLQSTDPPLTIPAWSAMMSGRDAGILGCYGIRIKRNHAYSPLSIATSNDVLAPRIWDYLSRNNRKSILLGIPQTYPIKPICGVLVAGMLAPNTQSNYVYPEHLKNEIDSTAGGYEIDIPDFRSISPEALLQRIRSMTVKRFKVFRHLITHHPWEFAMMVEIGLDRLHHCFWHYWDQTHPLYSELNNFKNAIPEYYELLDREIAQVLAEIPADTAVIIVSDHGAKAMKGGFKLNQWLINQGYLRLKRTPGTRMKLNPEMVDWDKTTAWGEGGYYGRLFLNVKGREPNGTVAPANYQEMRSKIAKQLSVLKDPEGLLMNNEILFPDQIYSQINGIPPDMMIYFDDLAIRSQGEVGPGPIFTLENDTGPDGANHSKFGIFITNVPVWNSNPPDYLKITQIAPMILDLLGEPVPLELNFKKINHFNFVKST